MKLTTTTIFAAALLCGAFATTTIAQQGLPLTADDFQTIGATHEKTITITGVCGNEDEGTTGGAAPTGPGCLPERDFRPIVDQQGGQIGTPVDPLAFYYLKRQVDTALRALAEHAERMGLTREEHAALARAIIQRGRMLAARMQVEGPQVLALMPPEGWTFELHQALERLEIAARQGKLTRAEHIQLRKRLMAALLVLEE
jgi:hypothetical protein